MEPKEKDWEGTWQSGDIGWDMGQVSPPLKEYIDQIEDKSIRILIPGCGNAYEAEYLHQQGFTNVHVIDIAPSAAESFLKRYQEFPKEHVFIVNFFNHNGLYDLVIEQTFFCAISPDLRDDYVRKMAELLDSGGKIAGVLFDFPLDQGPPFGGDTEEYLERFGKYFDVLTLERCRNSIPPRQGREVFMISRKK